MSSCRTSYEQFQLMIEFMEKNGDLSKPAAGPQRRVWAAKWRKLTALLNSEGSGRSQSVMKWRKVWSDFKNNTKRKLAKIKKGQRGTDGSPDSRVVLSDLEIRVLDIIGNQVSVRRDLTVARVSQGESQRDDPATQEVKNEEDADPLFEIAEDDEDWNTPGGSGDPTCEPSNETKHTPPPLASPTPSTPSPQFPPKARRDLRARYHRNLKRSITKAFFEEYCSTREDERERDRMQYELERERLRQIDVELQLQRQWLEFMNRALEVWKEFMRSKE